MRMEPLKAPGTRRVEAGRTRVAWGFARVAGHAVAVEHVEMSDEWFQALPVAGGAGAVLLSVWG